MKLLFSPWPGLSKHSCTSKNIKASFNCCSALRSHICTWELFLFAVNSLQNSGHLPEMDITPPRMAWLAMWWRNTYCLKQLHTQLSHPMERICQSIIVYIHHMVPRRDTYGTPLQYEQAEEEEEEEEGEEEQTRHSLRQVPTLRSPRLQNSCGRIWTKQISPSKFLRQNLDEADIPSKFSRQNLDEADNYQSPADSHPSIATPSKLSR